MERMSSWGLAARASARAPEPTLQSRVNPDLTSTCVASRQLMPIRLASWLSCWLMVVSGGTIIEVVPEIGVIIND